MDYESQTTHTVNVYDFDNTIYDGDSTVDFYKYCIRKYPSVMLRWPELAICGPLFLMKRMDKTVFKQRFYKFLRSVSDMNKALDDFWNKNEFKIKDWYYNIKKDSDIISSASPEFLLKPICRKLGVRLIASRVDPVTGVYTGVNHHGEEKVKRFREIYPNVKINQFYSDSLSDSPLAKISEKAFWVKGNDIIDWPGL